MNEQEAVAEAGVPPPPTEVEVFAPLGGPLPAPTWGLLLRLALPVLAQQSLYFLVNLSDLYLAAHVPTEHRGAVLSARTTAHYVTWFITCYNVLVTVGSTALVA